MKTRILVSFVLLSTLLHSSVRVQSSPQWVSPRTRVFRGSLSTPLTGPTKASPVAAVAKFLREKGRETGASLVSVAEARRERRNVRHLRMEQRVGGLWVYGTYLKAAVTERGELVHLIEKTTPLINGSVVPASIDERQALSAALRKLYPGLDADLGPMRPVDGDAVAFSRPPSFYAEPKVTRVAVPQADGGLAVGFLVETWSRKGNQLHETLIGGDGSVLSVESRTNNDSYNIIPINPDVSPQTVVLGPGAGNLESPAGWLFAGTQKTINIAGNNVHAYLDAAPNNQADHGGTGVSDGNFLSTFDPLVSPSTEANRNVSVQNLFYLNNLLHDELYRHGFDEAAGNFQEDNFGLGPRNGGSDSVNAEAQDGSGTDNGNFATPRDGKNPRMQIFLWNAMPTFEVVAGSTIFTAAGAEFGPSLNGTGVSAQVALANDGVGTTSDACESLPAGSLLGNLALVDRGTCNFVVKVKNAQNAGAVGVIISNNQGDLLVPMGGTDRSITIPSVFVGQTNGDALRNTLPVAIIRLKTPLALQRDATLDSDIVYHEYGHGLTWRMIGGMTGRVSLAVGEGMSDVLAILLNNDDRVGEYSAFDPAGIRRAPYTNYPRTYGDVTGQEAHDDGEVYAAIGWRLWQIFQANNLSRDLLLDYMVDGMNYTPANPSFEDMRDGILQAAAGTGHECLIWQAFAQYGVGVGVQVVATDSGVAVTESFVLPPQCQ